MYYIDNIKVHQMKQLSKFARDAEMKIYVILKDRF